MPVDSKPNCFTFSLISPQSCEGHIHASICQVLIEHTLLKAQDSNFPVGSELAAKPGVSSVFLSSASVYKRRNRGLLVLSWLVVLLRLFPKLAHTETFSGINSENDYT